MAQSSSWCFTIPNYTDGTLQSLRALSGSGCVAYLVFGREIAPTTGTPHLQGYVRFNTRKRFACVQRLLPQCHLTSAQDHRSKTEITAAKTAIMRNSVYLLSLSKGNVPTSIDTLSGFKVFQDSPPSESSSCTTHPSMEDMHEVYEQYSRACPRPVLRDGELRPWQADLYTRLQGEANDRTVEFIVDRDGGLGKSWFCGYVFSVARVPATRPGKRDDLAHAVDERSRIFSLQCPKGTDGVLKLRSTGDAEGPNGSQSEV